MSEHDIGAAMFFGPLVVLFVFTIIRLAKGVGAKRVLEFLAIVAFGVVWYVTALRLAF